MARTSGPACGSARARLCDHVDRLLAPDDDGLMRMHLTGCGECAGLAGGLAGGAAELPAVAGRGPGARFVTPVLARTPPGPALSPAAPARPPPAAGEGLKKDLGPAWTRIASVKTTNDTNRPADANEEEKGER